MERTCAVRCAVRCQDRVVKLLSLSDAASLLPLLWDNTIDFWCLTPLGPWLLLGDSKIELLKILTCRGVNQSPIRHAETCRCELSPVMVQCSVTLPCCSSQGCSCTVGPGTALGAL